MTDKPVAIAGFGCVSAAGLGRSETARNLREGRSGIRPVSLFSVDRCRSSTAGEVASDRLADASGDVLSRARRWSRASQMVLVAMAEALHSCPGFQPDAVIIGTTSGGMDLGEDFYRAMARQSGITHATRRVRGYPPQVPIHDAMAGLGLSAPVRVISNACASGTNALGAGWRLIRTGRAQRVMAGGYDALAQMVYAGFDCLQASTPELCRPFDSGRNGLVLGEGAAIFCLETEGNILVSGYGAATDTHHLTQPHPSGSGPRSAMEAALAAAGLPGDAVDHVNAHGTATPQNDACEARAIADVCPGASVTSTKAITGHALGAAGAIEAAFCALALQGEFLPPTLNFRRTDDGVTLDIVANVGRSVRPRRVLSNSFGFGGANASVLLQSSAC